MRLVVTGGAGYIGGFTARLLSRLGHEVVVVDDLSSGNPANAGEAELLETDFASGEVRRLLAERRIEAILHFAGRKSVAESWRIPERYHETNVTKTRELLDAATAAGVKHLVYSSSCSVYGDVATNPVDESHRAAPMNPYAESKWLGEQAIREVAEVGGVGFVILRYFNAAGADASHGERIDTAENLVPAAIKVALGLEPHLEIYGTDYPTADCTAVRDYIHVDDLARAHAAAINHLDGGGASTTLNVGTGRGTSVREIVDELERVSGRAIAVVEAARRPGDPVAMWADVTLAGRTLGWSSRQGIEEIIRSAWEWHSSTEGAAAGDAD